MRNFVVITVSILLLVTLSSDHVIQFSNAAINNNKIIVTKEVVKRSLELTKSNIKNENIDDAKFFSKFSFDTFSSSLPSFRQLDKKTTNEIHLLMIEMQSVFQKQNDNDKVIEKANKILSLLEQIQPDFEPKPVASELLSVADQFYQKGQVNNKQTYRQFSVVLFDKAEEMTLQDASFDRRQTEELQSLFDELNELVKEKAEFVEVGRLVNAIQRDVSGTTSQVVDTGNLFDVIHNLYDNLIENVEKGDYVKAEQLATEAYLENYEYLEPPIEKKDPQLMEKLEIAMREKLRQDLANEKPPEEIKKRLEVIRSDLKKAENLLQDSDTASQLTGIAETAAAESPNHKAMGSASESEQEGVKNDIDVIRNKLEMVLSQYQQGKDQQAYTTARSAYLDSYENVEVPLRPIDPNFTLEVELQFAELRQLIRDNVDFEKVQQQVIDIRRSLDESERLVTGLGTLAPAIAFTSSFALIFREGLESVLIIGAILTYLEASRNHRFKPYVYYGIVGAIGATAATWFVASYIIDISGASRELIEAIAALSATAILFYVSFWILNKIETKKWMEFIKAKVWQATTTGAVSVFALLSFFTVYREGFETVLFYQAFFGLAKHMESYVALGFVLGLVSLLAIYSGMRRMGKKLPLKALFGLTMGIGAYLSIAFIGNAIREMQTLDWISLTPMLDVIPRLDINLATMTGIHPTLETIVAQVVLLSIYLVAASYVLILRPKREEKMMKMRRSRKEIEGEEEHQI